MLDFVNISYVKNKTVFNFILVLTNLLGCWTRFFLMYPIPLRFPQFIRLCSMFHSLMIILKGHMYIFSEVNLRYLVDLRSLKLPWRIKLV